MFETTQYGGKGIFEAQIGCSFYAEDKPQQSEDKAAHQCEWPAVFNPDQGEGGPRDNPKAEYEDIHHIFHIHSLGTVFRWNRLREAVACVEG